MDLYIDSYLAYTFGPKDAVWYFARLLNMDTSSIRLSVFHHEHTKAFFITGPAMQNAQSSNIVQDPAVLLDYVIRPGGTVVPQGIWSSENPAHVRRYTDGPPSMPIFFVDNDRVHLGLPLLAAVEGDCTTLLCANDAPPIGNCFTAYIRISWPGYDKWTTQIMTKDRTSARNTIPLKKFANRIAKAVAKFLDEAAQRLCGQVPNWRVGDGDGGITKEQVILIGAVNVSQGSWQVILQINRYVMPRHPYLSCMSWPARE